MQESDRARKQASERDRERTRNTRERKSKRAIERESEEARDRASGRESKRVNQASEIATKRENGRHRGRAKNRESQTGQTAEEKNARDPSSERPSDTEQLRGKGGLIRSLACHLY